MSTIYTPSSTFHATMTVASDGDPRSAASVNSPIEAIADNAKYVYDRLSAYHLVADTVVGADNDTSPPGVWGSTVTAAAAYTDLQTGLVSFGVSTVATDIALVDLRGTLAVGMGASPDVQHVEMLYSEAGGIYASFGGGRVMVQPQFAAGSPTKLYVPFSILGRKVIGTGGTFSVKVQGKSENTLPNGSIAIVGGVVCHAQLWRLKANV